MTNTFGKLFRNLSTNKINCFKYNENQNYYGFVQEVLKQGYNQCIVTSDLMIKIMEHFLLNYKVKTLSIEFMNEDDELTQEIDSILELMKENAVYWEILKSKLSFLSENDSIEMKKVEFKYLDGVGSLFSVRVNGIIVVSKHDFDKISGIIAKQIEGCVK